MTTAHPQGFSVPWRERLPLPAAADLDDAQRAAAAALEAGPRKGVYGPFLPLLRNPALMERVGAVGEQLRYGGSLDARIRELAICAVSRHVTNQFEWVMHAPLALQAGVAQATLDAVALGARPQGLPGDEALALDFLAELLQHHGVCEPTAAAATRQWGEAGVVELTALAGYFVLVSWVMNVAHTPARPGTVPALAAFPL